MHEQHEHITRLFIRQFFNRATPDEKRELDNWVATSKVREAWYVKLMNRHWLANELQAYEAIDEQAGWSKLSRMMDSVEPISGPARQGRRWRPVTVAAAILIAIVAGITLWNLNNEQGQRGNAQGHEQVAAMQVVTTQLRQQQEVKLPDGSVAWLNAGSSISYPAALTGAERRVTMSGEVYLEVASNERPFIVTVNGVDIKAVGTRFNVNAYKNEAFIQATLLEGKLLVSRGVENAAVQPGQQASIGSTGKIGVLTVPNAEHAIAWKKGFFDFNKADVPSVMRQLNHWYGVTVTYKADTPATRITATLSRSNSLEDILILLDKSGIHTELKENQITVLP
jgi:ferric-dicitrate binding protein FerR (iron transport regulator)